jgi:hypothetical protein
MNQENHQLNLDANDLAREMVWRLKLIKQKITNTGG